MAERKPFLLRVDEELWKELCSWAEQELRSANGQIEWILREAVKQRKKSGATNVSTGKSKADYKAA